MDRKIWPVIGLIVLALTLGAVLPAASAGAALARVRGKQVNVRLGPGMQYPIIGGLSNGAKIELSGISDDRAWYFFSYWGRDAWITANPTLVTLARRGALPTIPPPDSDTPDLTLAESWSEPPIPEPGKPFKIGLRIENRGNVTAGEFRVAVWTDAGYSVAAIPFLQSGGTAITALDAQSGITGEFSTTITLDLEQQVDEGILGESNNLPQISVWVDHEYKAHGAMHLPRFANVDLFGGVQDVAYDGINLQAIAGALVALPGREMSSIHFDMLTPELVANTPIPEQDLTPGLVVGMYTAEGDRGILRILGIDGGLNVEYFIYA